VVYFLAALIAFLFVVLLIGLSRKPTPLDDALALRLAADVGGTRPQLVDLGYGRAQAWRFELEHEGSNEVFVHERGGRVRRSLSTPVHRGATVFAAKLRGRSQEDYDAARTLVPGDAGVFEVAAGTPADLDGWERRLDAAVLDRMQRAGVRWFRVDLHWLETGRVEDLDADWIGEAAQFLSQLEREINVAP